MGKIMMNGIQYGVGGITDADDVKYTDSQTVKGALDEVKSGLTDLNGAYQNETLATFYSDVKKSLFKGFASTGAFTQKLTKNAYSGAGTGYATYNSQYDFIEGVFYMNSSARLYAFRIDNTGTLTGSAYLAMTAA